MILGSCVFRVIWVYTIFAHFHTIPALYLLYPCSWIITAIAEMVYFVRCYRQAVPDLCTADLTVLQAHPAGCAFFVRAGRFLRGGSPAR